MVFRQNLGDSDPKALGQYNQSLILETDERLVGSDLEGAWRTVVARHAQLRARFNCEDGIWIGSIVDPESDPSSLLSWQEVDGPEPDRKGLAEDLQGRFDLSSGPLVGCILAHSQAGDYLILAAHHLVVDAVSWRIVVDDLLRSYAALNAGEAIRLSPVRVSYQRWWAEVARHSGGCEPRVDEERDLVRLPLDRLVDNNDVASTEAIQIKLSTDETKALLAVPRTLKVSVEDALIASLARAVTAWTGSQDAYVAVEGHGRQPLEDRNLDVSRTVGWFTTIQPVHIAIPAGEPADIVREIAEQLELLPAPGPWSVAQWKHRDLRASRTAWPDVSFNHLGAIGLRIPGASSFRLATDFDSIPGERHPDLRRLHLIDVTSQLRDGHLELVFSYSANRHRSETIDSLAESCRRAIVELLATRSRPLAPRDFPDVDLSSDELSNIAEALSTQGSGRGRHVDR